MKLTTQRKRGQAIDENWLLNSISVAQVELTHLLLWLHKFSLKLGSLRIIRINLSKGTNILHR